MGLLNEGRIERILRKCIRDFGLDLGGLVVFTEAATGPYLYAPILTALAGAAKVYSCHLKVWRQGVCQATDVRGGLETGSWK